MTLVFHSLAARLPVQLPAATAYERRLAEEDRSWAKMPRRLIDDLERGNITFAGFALRAWLIGRTNHKTGEYAATVSTIRDAVQWPWKSDQRSRSASDSRPSCSISGLGRRSKVTASGCSAPGAAGRSTWLATPRG
jgi:hypothetical protein